MEAFLIVLANLAPLAPMAFLAAGMTYWLRSSRWAWIAAGIIALCVPGIVLTWFLRDAGFHAFGGSCAPGKARGFMEAMQLVFAAQILAGIVGSMILGGVADVLIDSAKGQIRVAVTETPEA